MQPSKLRSKANFCRRKWFHTGQHNSRREEIEQFESYAHFQSDCSGNSGADASCSHAFCQGLSPTFAFFYPKCSKTQPAIDILQCLSMLLSYCWYFSIYRASLMLHGLLSFIWIYIWILSVANALFTFYSMSLQQALLSWMRTYRVAKVSGG